MIELGNGQILSDVQFICKLYCGTANSALMKSSGPSSVARVSCVCITDKDARACFRIIHYLKSSGCAGC